MRTHLTTRPRATSAICAVSLTLCLGLLGCAPPAPAVETRHTPPTSKPLALPSMPATMTADEEAAITLMRQALPHGGLSDEQFVLLYRSADAAIGSSAQQTTAALDEVISLMDAHIVPHDIAVSQFAALTARVRHSGTAEQKEALSAHVGCTLLIAGLC